VNSRCFGCPERERRPEGGGGEKVEKPTRRRRKRGDVDPTDSQEDRRKKAERGKGTPKKGNPLRGVGAPLISAGGEERERGGKKKGNEEKKKKEKRRENREPFGFYAPYYHLRRDGDAKRKKRGEKHAQRER